MGKTEWLGTVPDIGIAACETGEGNGLLTIADKGVSFVEPTGLADLEEFCTGKTFPNKGALGLDSLTAVAKTLIKDAALTIPRPKGESDRRRKGIPELDDYGVMGEITRKLLVRLLNLDKHIIVTAQEKYVSPDLEFGVTEGSICTDLPGQMAQGSMAMFDTVLRMKTRQKLRDPKDPKSRYTERYLITQNDGQGTIAKSRTKNFLDKEEVFNNETGQGGFPYLLAKILSGYAALQVAA